MPLTDEEKRQIAEEEEYRLSIREAHNKNRAEQNRFEWAWALIISGALWGLFEPIVWSAVLFGIIMLLSTAKGRKAIMALIVVMIGLALLVWLQATYPDGSWIPALVPGPIVGWILWKRNHHKTTATQDTKHDQNKVSTNAR